MRATLGFSLPDEEYEFRCAVDGPAWKTLAGNLDNVLREALKHGHAHQSADDALEWVRQELRDGACNAGLDLDS